MPELPDLLHVLDVLKRDVLHRRVDSQRVAEPVVLRFAVPGDLGLLVGRRVDSVSRRAHFVLFRFGDLELAINPMLAGRFRLAEAGDRDEGSLAFALGLAGVGPGELRYLDDKRMGKAYAYFPKIRREPTVRKLAGGFLDKVFDGAVDEYLVHVLDSRKLNSAELTRLEAMIAEARKRTRPQRKKGTQT